MGTTKFILQGSAITLKLYLVTIIFSIPLGIVCSLIKISNSKFGRIMIEAYTWLFRGTPLLLQLFFVYYALPTLGIKFGRFQSAALTFILNYGAYYTEIFRGAIESIDKGQYEAAKALGMNYYETMKRIILPQSIKRALPATSNEAITLIKDTALVAAISLGDILRAAKEVATRDFTAVSFVIAALIYLILTWIIVYIFKKLEQSYAIYS